MVESKYISMSNNNTEKICIAKKLKVLYIRELYIVKIRFLSVLWKQDMMKGALSFFMIKMNYFFL